MLFKSIFFFVTFFPQLVFAVDYNYSSYWKEVAKNKQTWEEEYWLRLLHFSKFLNIENSKQVTNVVFYVSNEANPRSELLESIDQIFRKVKKGGEEDHFICRFPARYRWIREHLNIPRKLLPKVRCNAIRSWFTPSSLRAISLLFSGAHVGNPASLFGHPMLRVQRRYKVDSSYLPRLDTIIDFGAEVDPDKSYVYEGLTGGFEAKYSFGFFDQFSNLYGNVENRDMWEYQLRFNDSVFNRLIEHSWELYRNQASFDYYFLKQNCALRIAEFLEVLYPNLELIKSTDFDYSPLDLLHRINNEYKGNFIKDYKYYPSLKRRAILKFLNLAKLDRERVRRLVENPEFALNSSFLGIPEEGRVYLIETAINLVKLRLLSEGEDTPEERLQKKGYKDIWLRLLDIRSFYPTTEDTIVVSKGDPLQDPKEKVLGISRGLDSSYFDFAYYYHDWVSGISSNYLTNHRLILMHGKIRYDQQTDVLETSKLTFFDYNYLPYVYENLGYGEYVGGNYKFEYSNIKDCSYCTGYTLTGGLSWNLNYFVSPENMTYLLTNFRFNYDDDFGEYGPEITLGQLLFPYGDFGVYAQVEYFYSVPTQKSLGRVVSKLEYQISPEYSVRIETSFENPESKGAELSFLSRW